MSFSKDQMKKLLCLSESEAERERLKFAVFKSSGMTNEKARTVYGFHAMDRRCRQILDAAEEAVAINKCMQDVKKVKQKVRLTQRKRIIRRRKTRVGVRAWVVPSI